MNRRDWLTAAGFAIFAPIYGRWFRQGNGLLVPGCYEIWTTPNVATVDGFLASAYFEFALDTRTFRRYQGQLSQYRDNAPHVSMPRRATVNIDRRCPPGWIYLIPRAAHLDR